jgi:ubiquinone/menaquinone biosynthesis C-methylase UbiE
MVTDELKQRAHEEFSGWADTYDSSLLNHFLFEPAHALMLGELDKLKPARVLDVGCGTGKLAHRLAQRGSSVVGLDLCEPMVRQARSRLNGDGSRVRLAVGDSEHLPFEAGSFDAVTCSNSFHHYPNQSAVVHEMFRVMASGGHLLILDGLRDNFIGRIMYDIIITRVEGDVWHRDAQSMEEMMRTAGFRDIIQLKRGLSLFPLLLTRGTAP